MKRNERVSLYFNEDGALTTVRSLFSTEVFDVRQVVIERKDGEEHASLRLRGDDILPVQIERIVYEVKRTKP